MKSFKPIVTLVVIGLVVIFIVQNAAVVEINFLFWSFQISRSLLIFIVICLGIISGWMLSELLKRKKRG